MSSAGNNKAQRAALLITILALAGSLQAQIYMGRICRISFFSEASLENIDATNSTTTPVLNAKNGTVALKALQNAFIFKSSLMQEHYNENYVESEKYPFATFTGKINEAIDYSKDQVNQVTVTGLLDMHGVSKEQTVQGSLEVKGNTLVFNATFMVSLADYRIKVPSLYFDKIAKTIKVTISTELVKK